MRFRNLTILGSLIPSTFASGLTFKLDFPRALELSDKSLQFPEKSCAISFDPRSGDTSDQKDALDKLNHSEGLRDFHKYLQKTVPEGVCVSQVLDLVDESVELVSATLTRSNYPEQPALICKYIPKKDITGGRELVAYTFDQTENVDVLAIKKKQMGGMIGGMMGGMMGYGEVEVGLPTPDWKEPLGFEFKDDYGNIKGEKDITLHSYYAIRWCNTIILRKRALAQQLIAFLSEQPSHSPVESQVDGAVTYSHGARIVSNDGKCAITFFRTTNDDNNYASMYQSWVHMNPHGLCFSGKDFDSVRALPGSVKLTRAVLATDRHTNRDVLKCFERVESSDSNDMIFADYLLPFEYKKGDPLRHNPDESKPIPQISGDSTYDVFSLTNYARFKDAGSKAEIESGDDSAVSEEVADGGNPKPKSNFLSSVGSALYTPVKLVSSAAGSMVKSVGNRINKFRGKKAAGEPIPFFDAHDHKNIVDQTDKHGDIAEKYCRHLHYLRSTFMELANSHSNALVSAVIPKGKGLWNK